MPSVLAAALCLAALLWLHDLDHVRQRRHIKPAVIAIGFLAYTAVWAVVVLAYLGLSFQFPAAIIVGVGVGFGLVVVHAIPDWGRWSDGFPTARVDAFSWLVLILAVGVAVGLAIVGAYGRS